MIGLVGPTDNAAAFMLGDADPFLNNISLEPRNPKPGDIVSINSSIYNQGTQSTNSVTDVVTVGYFLNGDLIKIDILPDVAPGENSGVKITTGPIWTATDGVHSITVILNYHDTLSHLTDNLENNIMQKIYYVGDWKNPNPHISSELFQRYNPDKDDQTIKIIGEIDLPSNLLKPNSHVNIQFHNDNVNQHYTVPINPDTGTFYFRETLPYLPTTIPITISYFADRDKSYESKSQIFPIKLEKNDSALILHELTDHFKSEKFLIAIYDESYNLIKKIETYNIPDLTMEKTVKGSFVHVALPGNQIYNVEVYSKEGNLIYASSKFLHVNNVTVDDLYQKWRETN